MSEKPEEKPVQPMAINTKFGVIACEANYKDCNGKADGAGCIDCLHNRYSPTKSVDNYLTLSEAELITADVVVARCEFGDIRIILGPNYSDCHIFVNGKEQYNVAGFYITGGFNTLTECRIRLWKPKE